MDIDMNRKESRRATLFDRGLVRVALRQSFLMLKPVDNGAQPRHVHYGNRGCPDYFGMAH